MLERRGGIKWVSTSVIIDVEKACDSVRKDIL
jgi:hypothetical protein